MVLGVNQFKKTNGKSKLWHEYFKQGILYKSGPLFIQYGILLQMKGN